MAQQARAVETRERVLQAAAVLFDLKGYEATTLNDIVEASGMTKGAVYFHFSSKAAIAVEVVRHLFDQWEPILEGIRSGPGDSLDHLIRVSFELARLYREDDLVRAAVRLSSSREVIDPSLPAPYRGWEHLATEMLREAAASGSVSRDVSAEDMARLVVAGFFGSQHISDVLDRRRDLEHRLVVMWQALLPVLTGQTAPGDHPVLGAVRAAATPARAPRRRTPAAKR